MPKQIRRIVTGHNAQGRSVIISDSLIPATVSPGVPIRAGLWLTDRAPASNRGNNDAVQGGVIEKTPPQHRGGTVFRISEIAPDKETRQNPQDMARRGVDLTPDRTARHPGFHRTNTVDYAICLEGEIWAVLDEAETLMKGRCSDSAWHVPRVVKPERQARRDGLHTGRRRAARMKRLRCCSRSKEEATASRELFFWGLILVFSESFEADGMVIVGSRLLGVMTVSHLTFRPSYFRWLDCGTGLSAALHLLTFAR